MSTPTDGNGNRASRNVNGTLETYAVDDADRLLSVSVGGSPVKTYAYDGAGRTTSVTSPSGTTSLSYDYEGRATQVRYPSGATNSFSYNGANARVSKSDSSGSYSYKRDGVEVTDPMLSDGSASYTPGVSERRGGASRFYGTDRLGSTKSETDSSQSVVATKSYDAFGNLVSSSGTSASPFGFAGGWGYQTDKDSGLMLLGNRYYDPSTGRFLTPDPIKDGRNWYTYADNNPQRWVHPEGLKIRIWGFDPAGIRKVRDQIHRFGRTKAGKDIVYQLINDAHDHIILPVPDVHGSDPHTDNPVGAPFPGPIRFDPDRSIDLPGKGPGGKTIPSPPDVILAHELGHVYGKDDPGGGADGQPEAPGDNVHDVENPYRRARGLPSREVY